MFPCRARRRTSLRCRSWPAKPGCNRSSCSRDAASQVPRLPKQRCKPRVYLWTIVRSSWFSQNFSEGYLVDGVLSGAIALPAREVPEPFVDVDDIADVVTAALTDARHIGKVYEVTGPRAITFSQAVAEISKAVGRQIRYTQISGADFAEGMRGAGVPDDVIHLLDELFTVTLDGRNREVQSGVMEALGRPPRDFADFARDAAAANAWRM